MLPKKDKEGIPYISYSQANLWSDVKGYNTGMDGKIEYMLSYFYKVNFPDVGFGGFGGKVGIALEEGDFSAFSTSEIDTLRKVERLDIFEKEIRIPFDGFYLVGYIDTCTEDLKYIKDNALDENIIVVFTKIKDGAEIEKKYGKMQCHDMMLRVKG